MLDWNAIALEYDQLIQELSVANLNPRDRARLQRRSSQFSNLLAMNKEICRLEETITESLQQAAAESGELKELYQQEAADCQAALIKRNQELQDLLYPEDERDERSVFVEIRAGTGGQEAALFASELFRMYSNYALAKSWDVSLVEENSTDLGGCSKIVAHIKGKNAFRYFKFESGVHRVQRVPKTETQGRIHTSTVTVATLPEADDVDFTINTADLRIDTYRSSGAGGQHVNTTDSAIRITHIPTGVVVTCQDERSQTKNKAKAMKVLQSRLLEAEREKQDAIMSAQRKQQVGSGERSEKIRTYNFPQNRITDHRTELTLKKLDIIMEGYLDEIIEPLLSWDLEQRRAKGTFLDQA